MAERLGTIDDVKKLAPELVCVFQGDPAIEASVVCYLDMWAESFDPCVWHSKMSFAHTFKSLHSAVTAGIIEDGGDNVSAVTSETFGGLSVSYGATHTTRESAFARTSYGQRYLDLKAATFQPRLVVGPKLLLGENFGQRFRP